MKQILALILFICLASAEYSRAKTHKVFSLLENEKKAVNWEIHSMKPHPDHRVNFTFALKQRNMEALEDVLYRVSDPDAPTYGEHWSLEDIRDFIAPSQQEIEVVSEWLRNFGAVVHIHESNDFLFASMNIKNAEEMFDTKFRYFEHKSGKTALKGVAGYSIPFEVAEKLDFVSHFHFPAVDPKWRHKKHEKIDGLRKSLPPGNAPIWITVYDYTGGSAFMEIIPRCPDGSIMTSSTGLFCGQTSFYNTFGVATGASTTPFIVTDFSDCIPCPEGDFYCPAFLALYGLPDDTIICGQTTVNLPFYERLTFYVQQTYSDGTHSPLTPAPVDIYLSPPATPQEIKAQYNIPQNLVAKSPKTSQGVASFLQEYYSPDDLAVYFELAGLRNYSSLVEVFGDNPWNTYGIGIEASLDIQSIMGMAPNVKTQFWSVPEDDTNNLFTWITNVLSTRNTAWVYSISYGDDENLQTLEFSIRWNNEYIKAGVRGISIFIASGDNGIFDNEYDFCEVYSAQAPASFPAITSVGGTVFSHFYNQFCDDGTCDRRGERGASTQYGEWISSGGGFSEIFPMPKYQLQSSLVQEYVNSLPDSPKFNKLGRVYPDISAIAHNVPVIVDGEIQPVGGTSASAPIIAGIFSLLNDIRFQNKKPPLGFVNPLIYRFPEAFNDIVIGNNGCSELQFLCCYGFDAEVGYDPSTGIGSPNFEALANIVKELR